MPSLPASFLIKESWIKRVLEILSQFDVVFKGGTSLSLTYGIIHRFSEDIDVSFYLNEDNKTNRISIRNKILEELEKETWITNIECIDSDIMIYFENDAPISINDSVIKPNSIKLELQDVQKKRVRPIATNIKPFEGANFKMYVADPFLTFTDKIALLFELTLSGELTKLVDDTKTMPRHLYDYLQIYKYLESKKMTKAISSLTKYVAYCKQRIIENIILKNKSGPRDRYNTTLWTSHILKHASIFKEFESFIRAHKVIIISIVNSVIYPGSKNFSIPTFLKVIKTNFKYYEKLVKEELCQ